MADRTYPKPVLRGTMFVSVFADGSMTIATLLDPETSDTGKWERIAFVSLRSRDVDGDAAETSGSVLGQQLAARLADLREGLLAERPIEMVVADVEASGELECHRSRCKVDGCRGRVSVKHGRGKICYAHRAHATGE